MVESQRMTSTIISSGAKLESSKLEMENMEQESGNNISCDHKLESSGVPEQATAATADTEEDQWLTGFRLYAVLIAVTIVTLLVLLDISIISTV